MNFDFDYIVPGEVFADEEVRCMRCAEPVSRLAYKEMPKINDSKNFVLVPYKMKLSNYRLMPVVLYRKGKETITHLVLCYDCIKDTVPEKWSDSIIRQIKQALQIEARWAGLPEESIQAVERQFADARIVRKLFYEEMMENRILEGAA